MPSGVFFQRNGVAVTLYGSTRRTRHSSLRAVRRKTRAHRTLPELLDALLALVDQPATRSKCQLGRYR